MSDLRSTPNDHERALQAARFWAATSASEPVTFDIAMRDAVLMARALLAQSETTLTVDGVSWTAGEVRELRRSIGELAMSLGNPCVRASGDQTIESQTVREAVRRRKEGT